VEEEEAVEEAVAEAVAETVEQNFFRRRHPRQSTDAKRGRESTKQSSLVASSKLGHLLSLSSSLLFVSLPA